MASTPPSGLDKLGAYTVIRGLGEGTFGKVKLAVHNLSGQHVALKFIQKGRISRLKVRTRIVREIEYLKQLKHPHIIKLYEVINLPNEVIMVMEYAGGELFNYIVENGRLPEQESRRFFQQMLYGLAHSHSHNIVHRDIKPENVLLDDANNVKLADFGLSNEMTDGSWLSTSCGSPNYASPEVISGSLYAGPEIDVWSLGVILYVMLCGRLPFEDEHVPALFQKITSGRYHVPQYLSEDARYLISGMLVVDPMKRLTILEILNHRWTNTNLPAYLQRMKSQLNPGRAPDTLTSILDASALGRGPNYIGEDIGTLDRAVFEELIDSLNSGGDGVYSIGEPEVRAALEMEGENAVKVAYKLIQDRRRGFNYDVDERRDAGVSPTGTQPVWIPPSGPKQVGFSIPEGEEFFTEGEGYTEEDEDEDDDDRPTVHSVASFETDATASGIHNLNWLDTSLVTDGGGGIAAPSPVLQPASHHLANYANMRTSSSRGRISPAASVVGSRAPRSPDRPTGPSSNGGRKHRDRDHYPRQPRWHFGIRSSSPPMEVMLELYRTLEALRVQWRQKRGIWASTQEESDIAQTEAHELAIEQARAAAADPTGAAAESYEGESREDLDVYYLECRWRRRDVVLLFDLQLYQVDAMNYLVDFRDLGYYAASTEPNAGYFDPRDTPKGGGERHKKEGDHPHPLLFLECTCRLILELAGGS